MVEVVRMYIYIYTNVCVHVHMGCSDGNSWFAYLFVGLRSGGGNAHAERPLPDLRARHPYDLASLARFCAILLKGFADFCVLFGHFLSKNRDFDAGWPKRCT